SDQLYRNSIELEYNLEQCYLALSGQLDWANLKGDKCLYDMSKPLPLQGPPGHLTIPVDFFFNNDLEYLKTKNKERKYDASLTKTMVVRYALKGIEDMIPKLWISIKEAYDKNVALGIHHWGPKLVPKDKKKATTPRKKSSIITDDNVLPDPDKALKLENLEAKEVVDTTEFKETALDHSKKLKGIKTLSEAAHYISDMKIESKASKLDYIIQQQSKAQGHMIRLKMYPVTMKSKLMKTKLEKEKDTKEQVEEEPLVDDQAGMEQARGEQAKFQVPNPSVSNPSSSLTLSSAEYGNKVY
nr:hypothetical protein [Tanacetum cinerariifolium]